MQQIRGTSRVFLFTNIVMFDKVLLACRVLVESVLLLFAYVY